jgi:hypothetical protein
MAVIPTPSEAKQIPDFPVGIFDGNSLMYQSRNGAGGKVSGDDVADYVAVNKTYTGLGNKTIPQAIAAAGTSKKKTLTLEAGETTLTFTDAAIFADSLIDVYAPVWYEQSSQTVGEVTLTFPEQDVDIDVSIKIS